MYWKERGHDPREFCLVPFGGAGGLHAVALARALQIPRVLLPASPGALSAIGVVSADVVKDLSITVMVNMNHPQAIAKLESAFAGLEKIARAQLRSEGFTESAQRRQRYLAARYQGQSFELQIKYGPGNMAAVFHRAHRARYGYAQESNVVEIVSARVRATGVVEKFTARRSTNPGARRFVKPAEFAETYFEKKKSRVAVYRRELLPPGSRLRTPCIVTEYSATTLVLDKTKACVDRHGNVVIDLL